MLKKPTVTHVVCFCYRSPVPPRLHFPSTGIFIDLVNTPRCEWEDLLLQEDVEEILLMVKRWKKAVDTGASAREAANHALTGKGEE